MRLLEFNATLKNSPVVKLINSLRHIQQRVRTMCVDNSASRVSPACYRNMADEWDSAGIEMYEEFEQMFAFTLHLCLLNRTLVTHFENIYQKLFYVATLNFVSNPIAGTPSEYLEYLVTLLKLRRKILVNFKIASTNHPINASPWAVKRNTKCQRPAIIMTLGAWWSSRQS